MPQPAYLAGPDDPASGPPQQRAGQGDEAERQQSDPARAAEGEADVLPDEPERCRGPQHGGQPCARVRGGNPADKHE